MKSLLGTLIMLSSVSASAGTAAYDQLLAGLSGPDCVNVAANELKQLTHPTWTQTFQTLGGADAQAYVVKEAAEYNVSVAKTALAMIKANLAVINNKKSHPIAVQNAISHNAAIYRWVNKSLNKQAAYSEVAAKAASCFRSKVKLGGTLDQQAAAVATAEQFIASIEGSVN